MKKISISDILRSQQTIFSFKDLVSRFGGDTPNSLKRKLNYYVQKGELTSVRKGFYAKDKDYNKLELATKIYSPSYISLETVLRKSGIIFQYSSKINIVSYLTREIKIKEQSYSYRKIKDPILTNSLGLKNMGNYFVASSERAFLDMLYLNKNYYFDNLSVIDWDKVVQILPIYSNKRMEKEINNYRKKLC